MRCATIHGKLDRFVEGRMPPLDREEVRIHLEGCAGCRAEEGRWRSLHRALEGLSEADVPADFASRVMARVEIVQRDRPAPARPAVPPWIAAAAIVAALLLCTLLRAVPAPFDDARATLLRSSDFTGVLHAASSRGVQIGAELLKTGPALVEAVPAGARIALIAGLLAATAMLGLSVRTYRREPGPATEPGS